MNPTMNLLRWYIEVGVLLTVGYGVLRAASLGLSRDSKRLLTLGHIVFVLALVLPAGAALLPREFLPHASVQVWSGRPHGKAAAYTLISRASPSSSSLQGLQITETRLELVERLAALLLLAAFASYLWRLLRLARVLRSFTEVRRIGRVSVLISDEEPVPFSAWLPGRAFVVLPLSFLARRDDFAIALRHEIQHHRQGDTRWVHLFEVCKALFVWNPAVSGWARMTERLQELACDEILIGRRNISPEAYGSCLFRVAQSAVSGSPALLAGTTGMAAGSASSLFLKRRIEMLFNNDRKRSSKWISAGFFGVALTLMAGSAFAARGLVQDRKLTLDEVKKLVARGPGGEIPITVNERVLHRLDQYVGSPEGRDYVKRCLARMPLYRPMIESKISAERFPHELLAMPMQESCFNNAVISPSPYRSRGIWQFIQPTALTYGLKIDEHIDERLDPEKETDAAMNYLKDLMEQFGDWRLAIKGYNEGEKRVQALIDQYHTRDPWKLEEISSSEDYLAGVMAMMIILDNPTMLD